MTAVTADSPLDRWRTRTESLLAAALPDTPGSRLVDAMRYALLGGGKRIRPCLVYAAASASGLPRAATDRAAVAIEMIHAYSLIHDDLPAMDDDDLRRGRPTCHLVFGEAMAILAGDALQSAAFAELAAIDDLPATLALDMIKRLAAAAGGAGMVLGQALDLEATGHQPNLTAMETIHRRKTGDLITASVLLGALSTGTCSPDVVTQLQDYGNALGLAFQVRDDLLDEEQPTAVLGKHSGADRERDKATYVSLLGRRGAHDALTELHARCHAALDPLGAVEALRYLADYAITRTH